jgi:hypothetical protein
MFEFSAESIDQSLANDRREETYNRQNGGLSGLPTEEVFLLKDIVKYCADKNGRGNVRSRIGLVAIALMAAGNLGGPGGDINENKLQGEGTRPTEERGLI